MVNKSVLHKGNLHVGDCLFVKYHNKSCTIFVWLLPTADCRASISFQMTELVIESLVNSTQVRLVFLVSYCKQFWNTFLPRCFSLTRLLQGRMLLPDHRERKSCFTGFTSRWRSFTSLLMEHLLQAGVKCCNQKLALSVKWNECEVRKSSKVHLNKQEESSFSDLFLPHFPSRFLCLSWNILDTDVMNIPLRQQTKSLKASSLSSSLNSFQSLWRVRPPKNIALSLSGAAGKIFILSGDTRARTSTHSLSHWVAVFKHQRGVKGSGFLCTKSTNFRWANVLLQKLCPTNQHSF